MPETPITRVFDIGNFTACTLCTESNAVDLEPIAASYAAEIAGATRRMIAAVHGAGGHHEDCAYGLAAVMGIMTIYSQSVQSAGEKGTALPRDFFDGSVKAVFSALSDIIPPELDAADREGD